MPFTSRASSEKEPELSTTASRREASLTNPLREGLRLARTPDPCALVVFGASGDLTRRKLFPAIYSLAVRNLLPERFAILGVARTHETDAHFRSSMKEAVRTFGRDKLDEKVWKRLAAAMHYVPTDLAAGGGENALLEALAKLDEERGTAGNRFFYLAVPPSAISILVDRLGRHRHEWRGWARLIVEKPFGFDRESARQLNADIGRFFEESEIYRIDHYLGKETVQNLLALRFANGIFEPIWNRQFVDHVEITVAESIGIEGRAVFYEQAGAIRDVFQNHLLQLVALTAMEPPVDFTSESVRNEKVKVLRAMHTPSAKHVVRGQYGRGFVEGELVPGYREEPGIAHDSTTETFVAAKLYVDNWRWADTPFYVRTGKRMPKRETTIAIQFQQAPHPPFAEQVGDDLHPNVLIVHVQPNEGVSLAIGAKVPGQGLRLRTVNMDFLYGGAFRTELPEAYERLILDALLGDATLFTRADEVDEQWALVDAIASAWRRDRTAFPNYEAGTWGPVAADELPRRDGREWRRR
jgi:glucose-6-phosphate 1-dehydrogenase